MSRAVVKGIAVQSGFFEGLAPIDPLLKEGLSKHISGKVKTQLQEIREKAAAEGHSEGYSEGYATGQAEVSNQVSHGAAVNRGWNMTPKTRRLLKRRLPNSVRSWSKPKLPSMIGESHRRNQLADLAIAIARRALAGDLHIFARERDGNHPGSASPGRWNRNSSDPVNPKDTGLLGRKDQGTAGMRQDATEPSKWWPIPN